MYANNKNNPKDECSICLTRLVEAINHTMAGQELAASGPWKPWPIIDSFGNRNLLRLNLSDKHKTQQRSGPVGQFVGWRVKKASDNHTGVSTLFRFGILRQLGQSPLHTQCCWSRHAQKSHLQHLLTESCRTHVGLSFTIFQRGYDRCKDF